MADLTSNARRNGDVASKRSHHKSGGKVQELRKELDKLHHQAKSNAGGLAGGGVSLWPAMEDMRLSREEVGRLVVLCAFLIVCTAALFFSYHGAQVSKLRSYARELDQFPLSHSLCHISQQDSFKEQLLAWHTDFLHLQSAIHQDFDVVWSETSGYSVCLLLLYIGGIVMLLYLLVENMFTKSRLTPARIKVWVSLLCIMTAWTTLATHMLVSAQWVESATRHAVLSLNEELALLVQSSLDLDLYHSVLDYWSTRCLPPRSLGVLSLLGLVQVQDLMYYLQYYSLPVLTAILTPFFRIFLALYRVYSV